MPDRLAMAAHELSGVPGITGFGGLCLQLRDGFGELQKNTSLSGLSLGHGQQLCAQLTRVSAGGFAHQAPTRCFRPTLEIGQNRIDTISTGAAHQPEHAHRSAQTLGRFWRSSVSPITTSTCPSMST